MQESLLEMYAQIHTIMAVKDPQEREQLKQSHQHMLQQHMQPMKDSGVMGAVK